MSPRVAGALLLLLGLLLGSLALFAWDRLSTLPVHRLRSSLLGPDAARALVLLFAAVAAALGVFLLMRGG